MPEISYEDYQSSGGSGYEGYDSDSSFFESDFSSESYDYTPAFAGTQNFGGFVSKEISDWVFTPSATEDPNGYVSIDGTRSTSVQPAEEAAEEPTGMTTTEAGRRATAPGMRENRSGVSGVLKDINDFTNNNKFISNLAAQMGFAAIRGAADERKTQELMAYKDKKDQEARAYKEQISRYATIKPIQTGLLNSAVPQQGARA